MKTKFFVDGKIENKVYIGSKSFVLVIRSNLLGFRVIRGGVSVALAHDGDVSPTGDDVVCPASVIVVNHMTESIAAPWHIFPQLLSKVVVCNCHLHHFVQAAFILCTEYKYLYMFIVNKH